MSTVSYRWRLVSVFTGATMLLALSGCSGGARKVTISGTVSYKGQPLSSGLLMFVGENGAAAGAPIQPDGKYTITDVTPGQVKVGITPTPQSHPPGHEGDRPTATADSLPDKYRDPQTSTLEYSITGSTTQLDIDIAGN